jgi:hypothetical protein
MRQSQAQPHPLWGPGLDAGALRQYSASLARRKERQERDRWRPSSPARRSERTPPLQEAAQGGSAELPHGAGRSGTAAYLQEQSERPPPRGGWGVIGISRTGRAQRRRCLPAVSLGGRSGEARRSVCSSALPSRRGPERGLAAQRLAGAVRRRRGISRCTDRSAGGCADRRTFTTVCARAWGGVEAAEASPRRRVRWRSCGRRWRGPSARATARPCRLSAVPAGPLTAARPDVSGKPLGCEPQPRATSASPAAGSAGEGSPVPLPGQTPAAGTEQALGLAPTSCPHALGKTAHIGGRTAAAQAAWAACLSGKHHRGKRIQGRRPCLWYTPGRNDEPKP